MGEIEIQRRLIPFLFAALGALLGNPAIAVTGPTQSLLRIVSMYTVNASALYVSFQSGAMPGCYGNAGGFLSSSNSLYKELYALLLTMVANGGMHAAVVYNQNAPTNNWSDCTIEGIYMLPQ